MSTNETKHAWLDDQAFYECCQAYRHAGITQPDIVVERFEELKAFIREQSNKESEPLRQQNAELVKALKEVCKQYENVRAAEGYPFPSRIVQDANELLSRIGAK